MAYQHDDVLRRYAQGHMLSGTSGPELVASVAAHAQRLGIHQGLIDPELLSACAQFHPAPRQLPTAAAAPQRQGGGPQLQHQLRDDQLFQQLLQQMQQQAVLPQMQQYAVQQAQQHPQQYAAQAQHAVPRQMLHAHPAAAAAPAQLPMTAAQLTAMRAAHLARLDSATSSASTAALGLPAGGSNKARKVAPGAMDAVAATAAAAAARADADAPEKEAEEDAGAAAGTDENEDGHTYAEYRSLQVRQVYPQIMGHPDPLVETASLASVPLPPATFRPSLDDCVEEKLLSDAQLETVMYANMKFSMHLPSGQRAGFFLGDGAGVGKGRQIAALIKQHFNDGGRRALWVSVSSDLRIDAARDLKDVRASHIDICPKGSEAVPTGRALERFGDGVLFVTYSLLISGLNSGRKNAKRKTEGADDDGAPAAGVAAAAAHGRINVPDGSRLAQIIRWLNGSKQPPLIVFDECHKAKNLLPSGGSQPTQTARAVVELQEQLPDAKVLYSSATGASEPKQLAYMTRLGLFGFKDASDMIDLLSKSKLGALELAAMSLKATGSYISRTLSYAGAEFALAHVTVDPVFKVMYDRSTMLWTLLWKIVRCHPRMKKLQGVFWSANQRFFKQMLMASKVPSCAQLAREAVHNHGMAVVIGLQSTGEANTEFLKETSNSEFDDLVSAPRMVLEQYVRTQFPLDTGGADRGELDSLEYQVFQAIQEWRRMLPASEVVAQKAQGAEAAHAAALMGLRVNTRQRQDENELIAMRLQMKKAALEEDEREAARLRQQRLEAWQRTRAKLQLRLRRDQEEAEAEVAAAEAEVARLQAAAGGGGASAGPKGKAKQAAQQHKRAAGQKQADSLEDGSSSEDEAPLSARAGTGSKRKRSKAAVVEDSSDDEDVVPLSALLARAGTGGKSRKAAVVQDSDSEDSPPNKAAKRSAAGRPSKVVASLSSSDDEAEPAAARPSARPKLAFKQLSAPVVIDLTQEDDLCCMVCGRLDDEESMLLCDSCDRGCHIQCAGLKSVPRAPSWHCADCERRSQQQHHQPCRQRLQQRAPAAAAASSDDDSDFSSDSDDFKPGPGCKAGAGGPNKSKMQLFAAQRKLVTAQGKLREAQRALEVHRKQTAEGPPPTPPNHSTRTAAAKAARPGSTSFDPTVRNLQLGAARPEGYRHAVKVHGLADLDLPSEGELAWAAAADGGKKRKGGGGAAQRARYDENGDEMSDEDELAEMDADFVVPDGAGANANISPQLMRMRSWLLRIIQAMELPPNPLDQLIELLGGEEAVAELTGRKGYVARDAENGDRACYVQRGGDGPKKDLNLREKEAFMDGRKLIAIISDAASTGISLQADRRAKNQRRRCHVTLELPWSADKAIQQFGRSHRANQVSAPQYRILTVPVGGEYRFASAAAKRLASLGALLRGDRNAIGAGSELKEFDIDNAHGEKALQRVLQDICGENGSKPMPGVKVPELPAGLALPEFMHTTGRDKHNELYNEPTPPFFKYMRTKLVSVGVLEQGEPRLAGDEPPITVPTQKARLKVVRFLNRLLGLPMVDQELLFQYFTDTLDATKAQLKSEGKLDAGIVTIKGRSCQVVSQRVIYKDGASGGEVKHVELSMDRGVPWEAALAFKNEVEEKLEEQEPGRKHLSGFYVLRGHDVVAGGARRQRIVLATEIIKSASNIRNTKFHIQRPNMGSTPSKTLVEMEQEGYRRLDLKEAEALWRFWFDWTDSKCIHGDRCSERLRGGTCHAGMRKDELHLICGAVLPIWQKLESMHNHSMWGRRQKDGHKWPLRVVKTIQEDGTPLVGVEATCRQELEFFVEGLNRPEPEEEAAGGLDPALAAALGYPAGGGFGVGPYRYGGRRGGGKKRGKKPRYFR
ncbi:hypothetical protein ABPG75_007610 [Micractinium tetrahymenae]